jgi:amino acid transporter
LFSITLITPIQFLVLGTVADALAEQYFHIALGWVFWILLFAVLISILTYCGIKFSTSTNVILGTLEIVVFLLLALWLLATADTSTTALLFTPSSSYEAGLGGWQGILHGMIFAFLAFTGFEASAPLAEEVRNPRRTVPRAILLATLGMGLFYVFCSSAGVIGWGITNLSAYSHDLNPWGTMAHRLCGYDCRQSCPLRDGADQDPTRCLGAYQSSLSYT